VSQEKRVTYLRKSHPVDFEIKGGGWIQENITIEDCSYPMEDCSPEINPSDKLQIIWWIGLRIENNEYSFVKHSDGS
jgi:hypothetical protein